MIAAVGVGYEWAEVEGGAGRGKFGRELDYGVGPGGVGKGAEGRGIVGLEGDKGAVVVVRGVGRRPGVILPAVGTPSLRLYFK